MCIYLCACVHVCGQCHSLRGSMSHPTCTYAHTCAHSIIVCAHINVCKHLCHHASICATLSMHMHACLYACVSAHYPFTSAHIRPAVWACAHVNCLWHLLKSSSTNSVYMCMGSNPSPVIHLHCVPATSQSLPRSMGFAHYQHRWRDVLSP